MKGGESILNVGDGVGGIFKTTIDGVDHWELTEDIINKVTQSKKGVKYYTKKKFRPLDGEQVDSNTINLEKPVGYIFIDEVFGLNDITRSKAEKWIENENNRITNKIITTKGEV